MSRCEKKKAGCGEHIDRISDLPSNVIDCILQCLSIQDIVKTSLLSRKWRYMWASVSRLVFTNNFFEKCQPLEISNIITEVLFLHNGPVHEFSLRIPSEHPIKMKCLSTWILFLSRKGVKELSLVNLQRDPYQTPSHIFSCRDLTSLNLMKFKLSTVPNFHGFKNLVYLYLAHTIFESGAFESLMSGCPLLELLSICYCSGFEHINISAPILKTLSITDEEILKSICLKQAQNLIHLDLWADGCGDNFERGWVSDLMKCFPKIERLRLGGDYIKIMSAMNPGVLLGSVDTLKYLELTDVNFNEGELLFILSLLESSPNLEELVIESDSEAVEPQTILKEFDCNGSYFCQLQIVNITVKSAYKHALYLIEFVLAKSSSLEILTFNVGLGLNQSDAPMLFRISCDLLQMKRASPRAEVKLFYDDDLVE